MTSSTNNITYCPSSSAVVPDGYISSDLSGVDVAALFKVICEVRLHPDFRAAFTDVQKIKMDKVLNNLLDTMIDVTDTEDGAPFNE